MVLSLNSYDGSIDAQVVKIGRLWLYFSGKICVAFKKNGKLTVCENIWDSQTGKHIARIPGQANATRIDYSDFCVMLDEICKMQ